MWKFWIAGVQISLLKITISQKWSKQDKVSDNCPKDRQKMENFLLKKIYWSWWEWPEFGHLNGSLLTPAVPVSTGAHWLLILVDPESRKTTGYEHFLPFPLHCIRPPLDTHRLLAKRHGPFVTQVLAMRPPCVPEWVATWSCAYGLLIQRSLEKAGKSRFGDRLRQCRCNTLRPEASHKCFKVM